MRSFPLFLDLVGKRVVIIGGGEQAAQKLRLALKTEARIAVITAAPNPEIASHAAAGRIALVDPATTSDTLDEATLAFIATGCAGADAALAALARARKVLVNTVDRPDLCDVTTPALVDRDPVVVAIGTEGTAPVLARQIKTRIEEMLEPTLGEVARIAGDLRPRVAARVPHARRRAFWDWFFDVPRRLLASGNREEATAEIDAALRLGAVERPGFVSLVGAGPGAADMITLRGVQRLQTADVIFHDRLVDPALLELARRDAERVLVGKAPGGLGWSQAEIDAAIVDAARRGQRVVRLKAGDPGIFGRVADEIAALDAAGIGWEIVAGVTAASAASADLGQSLTERHAIRSVTLTTGQVADGTAMPDWAAHAHPGSALAIYMGVAKVAEIQRSLIAHGAPASLPLDIVENASRATMRTLRTTLGDLATTVAAERVRNPAILMLRWPGDVARSAVVPFPEERRSHPDMGRTKRDRLLEVAAHPH